MAVEVNRVETKRNKSLYTVQIAAKRLWEEICEEIELSAPVMEIIWDNVCWTFLKKKKIKKKIVFIILLSLVFPHLYVICRLRKEVQVSNAC